MHYTKVKTILSQNNGMNLYRGCSHGCIYCDSRSKCYQINHEFEDIEIKENTLELLENTLKRKRKKCMIGTGSMSDPYIQIEKQIKYTKKSLMLAKKYGFGYTLLTKSTLVLRDIDLIREINEQTKCVVQMTLTTFDESLCKILEPNVSTTKERFEALKILNKAGIPTIVWFGPILPYINDNEDNLRNILNYCILAKVKGIVCFDIGLTLRDGNREYFYDQLDKNFTGLKEKYISTYGDKYMINSPNSKKLMKLFHEICEQNNIMHNNEDIFKYISEFEEKHKIHLQTLF